jgi:hypothetical protein
MWKNNIKSDLREIGWDDMDWIDLAQDRSVEEVCSEYGNEFSGLHSWATGGFLRRNQLHGVSYYLNELNASDG